MGFIEIFAVVGRVGVHEKLLAARAPDKAGNQPAARDHIDHRELFGQPQWVAHDRRRIAKQHDLAPLGRPRQHRGLDIHHRAHAEGRPVMLVQHHAVEAQLVAVDLLVEILVQDLGAFFAVQE